MGARAVVAEFIGTFMLVLAIAGSGAYLEPAGAGVIAIAVAAGLALTSISYALGHVSGGHFNPAVSVGLVVAGRFDLAHAAGYIGAQIVGGVAAVGLLALVVAGGGDRSAPLATLATVANTYGGPGQATLLPVALIEAVASGLLVVVVIGATSRRAVAGMAPIAIGFAFALLHLVAMPISTAGLNPARSTAVAVFSGADALADLWLFWLSAIVGAAVGGWLGRWLQAE